jgi:hypothetical protein
MHTTQRKRGRVFSVSPFLGQTTLSFFPSIVGGHVPPSDKRLAHDHSCLFVHQNTQQRAARGAALVKVFPMQQD